MSMMDAFGGGGAPVGVEVGAGVDVDLSIRLGRLADSLDRQTRAIEAARQKVSDSIPTYFRLGRRGGPNASNVVVIDLEGPMQGRKWELRSIVVGGAQATSSPAMTAGYLFASMGNPDSAQTGDLSILNLRDLITQALPQSAFYSADQMAITYPERFWIVLTGATAAQYVVSYEGLDYDEILGKSSAVVL